MAVKPMAFWDSSALIPLCVRQEETPAVVRYARQFERKVVWWASLVESHSGLARLEREGQLSPKGRIAALGRLNALKSSWYEILPGEGMRETAANLLWRYPLVAADALQLAASLTWCKHNPRGCHFVCFDERLCDAAAKLGFWVLS
ncbi:MAG: type II toxin-antitoxin system VapC family toxin [Pyrinomonadaceae bacterium]